MDDARKIARALGQLPLFPLPGGVLLPYGLVPLHVFEPRYRAMVRDCQRGAGVLALASIPPEALRKGEEPPRVLPIVGVGLLARVELLPDGRSNIVLRGVLRARIVEELKTAEPYRLVRAEKVSDLPGDALREEREADSLRQLVLALCSLRPGPASTALAQMAGRAPGPGDLADAVAGAVVEVPAERQLLLEMLSVEDRLRRVAQHVAAALAEARPARDS